MNYLRDLVTHKIQELGSDEAAAEFFAVSPGLVAQWRTGSKSPSLAAVERVFDPEKIPTAGRVEQAAWEGKQVCLLLPWYKQVTPQTALSLMSLIDRTKMGILMRWGDAFIIHARNALVAQFLKTGVEWSFWVDDDVILPTGDADRFKKLSGFTSFSDQFAGAHALNRLLSHKKTLVGGVYFGRTPDGKPLYAEGCASQSERLQLRSRGPQDVVKPTRWVATGALLAHRKVYEDIKNKFPHLENQWFSPSEHDLIARTKEALAVLSDGTVSESSRVHQARILIERGVTQSESNSRLGNGEDVQFCLRALEAGHQPYVDLGLICGHIGPYTYGPMNTHG